MPELMSKTDQHIFGGSFLSMKNTWKNKHSFIHLAEKQRPDPALEKGNHCFGVSVSLFISQSVSSQSVFLSLFLFLSTHKP